MAEWKPLSSLQVDSDSLAQHYSHFRDLSPTADSLYHAVSLFLLDYFTHPSTPLAPLELFYKRLFYLELPLPDNEYIPAYATVLEGLWRVREAILAAEATRVREICEKLQGCAEYMRAFTQVLRCLAYEGIMVLKPDQAYSPGAEEAMKEMLRLEDQRVEDVDLWGLAAALDVNLIVERLDLEQRAEYPSVRAGEHKLRVSIATVTPKERKSLYSPYYPLYPQGWEGAEQARFEELLHLD